MCVTIISFCQAQSHHKNCTTSTRAEQFSAKRQGGGGDELIEILSTLVCTEGQSPIQFVYIDIAIH